MMEEDLLRKPGRKFMPYSHQKKKKKKKKSLQNKTKSDKPKPTNQ